MLEELCNRAGFVRGMHSALVALLVLMLMQPLCSFRRGYLKSPQTKQVLFYSSKVSLDVLGGPMISESALNLNLASEVDERLPSRDVTTIPKPALHDISTMTFNKLSTVLWDLSLSRTPKSSLPADLLIRIDRLLQDERVDSVDLFRAMNSFLKIGLSWNELSETFRSSYLNIIVDISNSSQMHRELASYVYLLGKSGMNATDFSSNQLQLLFDSLDANIGTMYGQCVANTMNGLGKIALSWDQLKPSLSKKILKGIADVSPTMKNYELLGTLFSLALMKVNSLKHQTPHTLIMYIILVCGRLNGNISQRIREILFARIF